MRPLTIIDDPADWTAASLAGKEQEYSYRLTAADVEEILQVGLTRCTFANLHFWLCQWHWWLCLQAAHPVRTAGSGEAEGTRGCY